MNTRATARRIFGTGGPVEKYVLVRKVTDGEETAEWTDTYYVDGTIDINNVVKQQIQSDEAHGVKTLEQNLTKETAA